MCDNLPSSRENSVMADALDAVLELRGYVEEIQAAELPKPSSTAPAALPW